MAGEFLQVMVLAQAGTEGDAVVPEDAAGTSEAELHEGTVAEEHGGPPDIFPPFDASTFGSQILWLVLTFGALYLLMSKVALPRIGEILEIRRDRIESDLAEAERLRQRTDKAIQSYEEALAEARRRAHEIAEKTRGEIRADLGDKRAGVEAGLAAKMATAEQRIQQTKIAALSHVEEIATDTATTLVSLLLGRVPAKSIKDAVKQVSKGG